MRIRKGNQPEVLQHEKRADGQNLVPLLQGKKITDRPLFWHYPHYGIAKTGLRSQACQ